MQHILVFSSYIGFKPVGVPSLGGPAMRPSRCQPLAGCGISARGLWSNLEVFAISFDELI